MKISYNWIKNYLNLNLPADEVATLLTDTGLEVEGIEIVESIKGGLKGVVIGEVLTKIQHPNADRLSLTTVNIGEDEPLQIVCGAPNVNIGQKSKIGSFVFLPKSKISPEDKASKSTADNSTDPKIASASTSIS